MALFPSLITLKHRIDITNDRKQQTTR